MPNIVHDYEVKDFFDVIEAVDTTNGKRQLKAKASVSITDNGDGTFTATNGDGTSLTWEGNNDIEGATLEYDSDKNRLLLTIEEGGNSVLAALKLNFSQLQCKEQALVIDDATGKIHRKPISPPPRAIQTRVVVEHEVVSGAAVDALVGNTLATVSATLGGFTTNADCYPKTLQTADIGLGSWRVIMPAGDEWVVKFRNLGDVHYTLRQPAVIFTNSSGNNSEIPESDGRTNASWTQIGFNNTPMNFSYEAVFEPTEYTPSPNNQITGFFLDIQLTRLQVAAEGA